MNIRVFLLPTVAMIALSACGKGPKTSSGTESSSTPPGAAASATASAAPASAQPASSGTSGPAAAATADARTIEITANDQMKFSLATMEAKPGESLRVVLTNVGMVPKEAMGHNWVLLKSGSDVMAFSAAAAGARDSDYIPANLKDQVIAHIQTLGPKQKGEVSFKAPQQPGEYPFLCSFPGHAALMKGVLTVK